MKILTYTVLLFVLVSCASKKKEIEIIPPDKLYERAMKKLKNNSPEAAAEDFERVEAENPFSKYSSKSIIMAAYSYYYAGEYDSSLSVINYIKKTSFDYLDYAIKYAKKYNVNILLKSYNSLYVNYKGDYLYETENIINIYFYSFIINIISLLIPRRF